MLFRIDHDAPPDANTEEELRAQQAKLVTINKGAKDDGIKDVDIPYHIREKVGWFDYRTGMSINPKGLEWKCEVDGHGDAREGPINAQGKIDGLGVRMDADGDIYEGHFENDRL